VNNEDNTIKELFEAEKFANNLLKKENKELRNLKFQLDKQVLSQLKEIVILDVSKTLHEMQFKLDALLCFYANKVDSKTFPLNNAEETEARDLMLEGYKAFLNGIKEDAKTGDEFKKGGKDVSSKSNQIV